MSGLLSFSSGTSSSGSSGFDSAWALAAAVGGKAGAVSITVGGGDSGVGGLMTLAAGESTVLTGGAIGVTSGEGVNTSSGAITIRTANAGTEVV